MVRGVIGQRRREAHKPAGRVIGLLLRLQRAAASSFLRELGFDFGASCAAISSSSPSRAAAGTQLARFISAAICSRMASVSALTFAAAAADARSIASAFACSASSALRRSASALASASPRCLCLGLGLGLRPSLGLGGGPRLLRRFGFGLGIHHPTLGLFGRRRARPHPVAVPRTEPHPHPVVCRPRRLVAVTLARSAARANKACGRPSPARPGRSIRRRRPASRRRARQRAWRSPRPSRSPRSPRRAWRDGRAGRRACLAALLRLTR